MRKERVLRVVCVILIFAIIGTLIWGYFNKERNGQNAYDDGIEQIDLNTIYLVNSDVQVGFSEILLGKHEETRKLIVTTQEATVSTKLTDHLIKKIDFDFMKKTQEISYTGEGYFVVDLDNFTKDNIIEDKKNKTITIKIGHAYLQAIEIDPNKIVIDEVKQGLLARGDIELNVKDYNAIEKQIMDRMEEKFDTVENGQEADTIALQMVKDIYEPIIKAIDSAYTVYVEFI